MSRGSRLSGTSDLLARHAELEETLGDGDGGNFISGWQCLNPWHDSIRNEIDVDRHKLSDSEYLYADRFPSIEQSFTDFHSTRDVTRPERIIFGSGSTALLLLAASWISLQGFEEVFYVAPMYFTLHSALTVLGIRPRPINGLHPYEESFSINLPPSRAVLILTDPIWYSGTVVSAGVIKQIREWQLATGSLVLVDGSFQYMAWSHADVEPTASLSPALTLRIICPSKQLVMHGYRASYALVPNRHYRELLTLHSHLFGSLSTDTIAFFLAAGRRLLVESFRSDLMSFASDRHSRLRARGVISAPWRPSTGYFCFEKILDANVNTLVMDGSYFEQPRFPGFARVNLLSPQIGQLYRDLDVGLGIKLNQPSA